jgi:predicted nucleotide-binding protein
MLPRKPPTPKRESKTMTPAEQRAAIGRLEARIKELRELDASTLQAGDDPPVQELEQRISSTLASIYGQNSPEYARLRGAAHLDATSYTLSFVGGPGTSIAEIREGVNRGRHRAIAILRGEADALTEHLQFLEPKPADALVPAISTERTNEVFVVHGRDEAAKEMVARVIQRAGLEPIILHEQANGGKTIIEKFEKHGSTAGFAVVIATPDDVGGLVASPPDQPELRPRARQNVVGEMFWFAGRLGREKVCALVKGNIEMPSDFAGVVYTPMDDHGGWKGKLLQELNAAGYENLNWQEALK